MNNQDEDKMYRQVWQKCFKIVLVPGLRFWTFPIHQDTWFRSRGRWPWSLSPPLRYKLTQSTLCRTVAFPLQNCFFQNICDTKQRSYHQNCPFWIGRSSVCCNNNTLAVLKKTAIPKVWSIWYFFFADKRCFVDTCTGVHILLLLRKKWSRTANT